MHLTTVQKSLTTSYNALDNCSKVKLNDQINIGALLLLDDRRVVHI
jgi:hypothetical protein